MNGQRKSLERSHSLDEPQMTSCGKLLHMTGGRSESTIEINLSGCHGLYEICPPPSLWLWRSPYSNWNLATENTHFIRGSEGALSFVQTTAINSVCCNKLEIFLFLLQSTVLVAAESHKV